MPASMLQELSQEVLDFDRQMGCMASMFQIFARRRLLNGRQCGDRGTGGALPPDHTLQGSSMYAPVQNSANPNIILEKSFDKSMTENSSLSKESSRASSSSSSCSPIELSYINKEAVVGRTLRSSRSLKSSDTYAKSKQPNTDFRDVIMDSINRDSHGLAVKASTMARRNGLHKDSPRPLLISKSTDGTYMIAVDRSSGFPACVDESSRQPRLSCDDRQLLKQLEVQDRKTPSAKHRELPRLSLDSRKESVRTRSHLKNLSYARTDDSLIDNLKTQESPSNWRASSVIAKLMGLEETIDIYGPARSPRPAHDTENGHRPPHSPKSVRRDPSVSQPKIQPPILKTKPSPRVVPEDAPRRQQDIGTTGYYAEARPRSASVYDDIERRLSGLELSVCNIDLRALRILGKLHAEHTPCQSDTNVGLPPTQKAAAERTTTSQDFRSPIVIMKPATGIARPDASVVPLAGSKIYRKLQHDECPFTRKSDSSDSKKIHSHTERARSSAERAVGRTRSPKPSRLSPRPVPRLPVPLRSPTKTSTSMGRLRLRASQANSICSVDKVLTPESKISLSKHVLMGIISYPNSLDVNKSCVHQSNTISTLNHEETPPILCFDKKNIHPLENIPSPVSILDATLYQDGSSPSLRRISNSFKDGETHTLDEYCNPASLPDTPPSKISSEDSQIVPETMKSLIQKLELLKLSSDEAPRPSGSLWTVTANKYQHYIYEILSASALLHRELSSGVMPHQSQLLSYPINPELFVILEQSKPTMERQHRKLIFDLTNELIGQKMHNDYSVSQSVQFRQSKRSSGQHLVKELCIEIERLQSEASVIRSSEDEDEESMLAEDALRGMGEWKSFYSEIQGMVLDIEKFIFKDLIDEVISGEAMGKVHLRQWKIKKQLSLRSI